jgi:hypothetical protein
MMSYGKTLTLVLASLVLLVTYSTIQIAVVLILLRVDGNLDMDEAALKTWLLSAAPFLYLPVPVYYCITLLALLSFSGKHTIMDETDTLNQATAAKDLDQICQHFDKGGEAINKV